MRSMKAERNIKQSFIRDSAAGKSVRSRSPVVRQSKKFCYAPPAKPVFIFFHQRKLECSGTKKDFKFVLFNFKGF